MAQDISLLGAVYSDVPSVLLPKQGGGTAQFDDTTDADATASDILTGKTAYVNGVKITGTGTGGGGSVTQDQDGFIVLPPTGGGGGGGSGLVFEQGTWTPSVDTVDTWLNFTDTHTEAPFYYMITDESGTELTTEDTNHVVIYSNYGQLFGDGYIVGNTIQYGIVVRRYRNGVNSTSGTTGMLLTPYTSTASSTNTDSRFWATETGIRAYYGANYCTWRANRTYKWIAIWKPTT